MGTRQLALQLHEIGAPAAHCYTLEGVNLSKHELENAFADYIEFRRFPF